jgi:LysM repeat protein
MVPPTNVGDGRYWQSSLTVQKPDHVERLAQALGVSADHLKAWNNLISDHLYVGQQLIVWRPVIVQRHSNVAIEAPAAEKPAATTAAKPKPAGTTNTGKPATPPATQGVKPEPKPEQTPPPATGKPSVAAAEFQWHTVGRNESLTDIARMYNVPLAQLRTLNGDHAANLQVGARIKVKAL